MLSHPTIVEIAETSFVPLSIYNNTEGDHDAAVRIAFDEPAWNNPVVRFVDHEHRDLVPPITSDWSLEALARGMASALEAAGEEIPPPLRALLGP